MLVEPHDRLARRVAAQIRIGGETGRRGVSERQCRLEFDEAFLRIVVNHEGRCHSRVLTGCDPVEVDDRDGQLGGRA